VPYLSRTAGMLRDKSVSLYSMTSQIPVECFSGAVVINRCAASFCQVLREALNTRVVVVVYLTTLFQHLRLYSVDF
jgi:hypothetical protein